MTIWALISGVDDMWEGLQKAYYKVVPKELKLILMERLDFEIESGNKLKISHEGESLPLPDAFWPTLSNTESLLVERMLLEAGVPSIVNTNEVAVAKSKILTYQRLAENGVRVPKSVVFFQHSPKEAVSKQLGYPFVVKPDGGFGGEGVELVENEAQFDAFLAKRARGIAYVAQEFIATSHGKDVRVVMLNGQYLYSVMRSATNPKEFRSNFHVGGELADYEIDETTKRWCEKTAALFDLPLIGLDLLFGEGEFVVAEVNAFPGLFPNHMQTVSGAILGQYMAEKGAAE